MNRSLTRALLGVASLAFVAGVLQRIRLFLPALTTHGGPVAPAMVGHVLTVLQWVAVPLAGVGLGYAAYSRGSLERRPGEVVAVVAVALVGCAVGVLVGTVVSGVGFAAGRVAMPLRGVVTSVVTAVALTIAVVGGAALAAVRES